MQRILLTTTFIFHAGKAHMDNSKSIRDACNQSSSEAQTFLQPIISISNPYGETPEVKFVFPYEKGHNKNKIVISNYTIVDHDPLKITFEVSDGVNTGKYQVVEGQENGEWTGFFIQNNRPVYSLSGTMYVE